MTGQCVLNYESHEKVKPLLQAFEELGLYSENVEPEEEEKEIKTIKTARSEEAHPLHTEQD